MNPVMLLAGGAAAIVAVPIAGLVFLGGGSTAAQADACPAPVARASSGSLSAEQSANATTIVDVGEQMAVPSYGRVIAVAVALQESDLRDLDYGDADSLGLFQQRPSQGWGSPAQILDADYAATAFYQHLLAVPGWESMPFAQAAQAVQRSAFPDAYAKWQAQATSIVQGLSAGAALRTMRDPSAVTPRPLGPTAPLPWFPVTTSPSTSQEPPSAASTNQQLCGVVALTSGSVAEVLGFASAQVGKAYGWARPGRARGIARLSCRPRTRRRAWRCRVLRMSSMTTRGPTARSSPARPRLPPCRPAICCSSRATTRSPRRMGGRSATSRSTRATAWSSKPTARAGA